MIILGLDIGTSGIKAVLIDGAQQVVASATVPLATRRPRPGWSEQDPRDWIEGMRRVLTELRTVAPAAFGDVGAIGLSGQMHGAVVLDAEDTPLRPAILWNDGRAEAECAAMLAAMPELAAVTGVPPMPGLTAPKLLWLRRHEPEVFARIRKVICPKDFVRLYLTGEMCTDLSDAAGTLWLDEAQRRWSAGALAASGLGLEHMPRLLEGTASHGVLRPAVAAEFGWRTTVVIAGGAGDAAAAAVGLGAIADGDAFVSLGTSSQLFVTTASYRPRPETLVHAFAHCLPARWFQMAAMLNGASALAWFAGALGRPDIDGLLAETEAAASGPSDVLFLPYLVGERTPHNDALARGVFIGLSASTGVAELTRAVLEGVAYTIQDARAALEAAGTPLESAGAVGGGSRNTFWLQIISDVTGLQLRRYAGTELGPAFGAARLARVALTGESVEAVCAKPPVVDRFVPNPAMAERYAAGFERYRRLYAALKPEFGRKREEGEIPQLTRSSRP